MTSYDSANEAKSSFNDVYQAPTPHAYFAAMHRLEYAIGQEARPYFQAAAALLRRQLGAATSIRMLDLGCSYGVGSALVKYGLSFGEIAEFFENDADRDFRRCVRETRQWLEQNGDGKPITCIGADSSEPAIRFAAEAGLIADGIAHDLEADPHLDTRERATVAECNLLTSTGTIGYVGENTLSPILRNLGKAQPFAHGPYAAVTILRMFPPEPIAATFNRFGMRFEVVPGVRLRQRRFDDDREQQETLRLLRKRGLDPEGWESTGYLYADLFVGARPVDFGALMAAMVAVDARFPVSRPAMSDPVS